MLGSCGRPPDPSCPDTRPAGPGAPVPLSPALRAAWPRPRELREGRGRRLPPTRRDAPQSSEAAPQPSIPHRRELPVPPGDAAALRASDSLTAENVQNPVGRVPQPSPFPWGQVAKAGAHPSR